jgi:Na+/H+-translocating membrane pyrophosphatase
MADKSDTTQTDKADANGARIATIAAGAVIGSAAIAAAVLFATRKRDAGADAGVATGSETISSDRTPPETD